MTPLSPSCSWFSQTPNSRCDLSWPDTIKMLSQATQPAQECKPCVLGIWQTALIALGSLLVGFSIGATLSVIYHRSKSHKTANRERCCHSQHQTYRSNDTLWTSLPCTLSSRPPLESSLIHPARDTSIDPPHGGRSVSANHSTSQRRHRSLNSAFPEELLGLGISEEAFSLSQSSRRPTRCNEDPIELSSRRSSLASLMSIVFSGASTQDASTPRGRPPDTRLRTYQRVHDLRAKAAQAQPVT